jgi:hypothetical protein
LNLVAPTFLAHILSSRFSLKINHLHPDDSSVTAYLGRQGADPGVVEFSHGRTGGEFE